MSDAPRNELDPLVTSEREEKRVPSGGQWFWRQAGMLANLPENGFAVAWDSVEGKSGPKIYGAYPTAQDFYQNLLLNPPNQRWAYEFIPESARCKAYMDVEWRSDTNEGHTRIREIVAEVRSRFKQQFNEREPEIYVCCGSRPDPTSGFKNSYHVVIGNMVFQCNHDGLMRRFFTPLAHQECWYHTDSKGVKHCCVDLSVYTKKRVFRLPLASKRGPTIAPLVRVSADPFDDDDDFASSFYDESDFDNIMPMLLTVSPEEPDFEYIETPASVQDQLNQQHTAGKKRKAPSDAPESTPDEQKKQPLSGKQLEHALFCFGDKVSKVTKIEYIPENGKDKWKIQCDQHKRERKCLHDKERRTHSSNNCLLFLTLVEEKKYDLEFHCTASECRGLRHIPLGYFSFKQRDQIWRFTKEDSLEDSFDPELPEQKKNEGEDDDAAEENTQKEPDKREPKSNIVFCYKKLWADIDHNNPVINTYELVKERFEKQCFKVNEPFVFARIKSYTREPTLLTPQLTASFYRDVTFWGEDKDGILVKKKFIDVWLDDINKREVEKIIVEPEADMEIEGTYNMWSGFLAEKLPPVDPALVSEMVKPIIQHIREVMVEQNEQHTDWFLDLLANMFQQPKRKSGVVVYLYGTQGCGKGILLDWMRLNLFGKECSTQTAQPVLDLFSRFSAKHVNRVFIQVDEAPRLHEYNDQLKNLCTADELGWEIKNVPKKLDVTNMCNVIMTSNNEHSLQVSTDDRRYVLFQCNPKYKGDYDYFRRLGGHLKKDGVARAFYQYLMARDLSQYEYSYQDYRPITKYYREVQQMSIKPTAVFVSALINDEKENSYPASVLFGMYKTFAENNNFKYVKDSRHFGRDLRKIKGIDYKKKHGGNMHYIMDFKEVKEFLVSTNEFDPFAMMA